MTTYLLEIGLEEVPARFMPGILSDLKTRWETALGTHRIDFTSVETTGTYRRLTTIIDEIALASRPDRTRIRGPITSIAIGPDGSLTPAGNGFLKKNNLTTYAIETEGGKENIVGYIDLPAQNTIEILGKIATEVSLGISLPIAMTWGIGIGPFIRPIHWILSLLDSTHIPVQLFDIHSGTTTRGHRFLGIQDPLAVPTAKDYFETLRQSSVTVTHTERHDYIVSQLQTIMGPNGAWGADLVEEVTFLTEYPIALVGEIDPIYMNLPQEAIIECIQKNQKYFPVIQEGKLTSRYIVIADSVSDANKATILHGNHSVIRARLEDVRYFWEEDLKSPLAANLDKLKSIVYQKGLGSVWDKTQRIMVIAKEIATLIDCKDTHSVTRGAALCKADLVSQMVLEMPTLQGVMGGIYAQKSGESAAVADAISSVYEPEINTENAVSTAVAMADRLDTVVSCFANGLVPTGSQDPWGVRRAALAVVRAARDLRLKIALSDLVRIGYSALDKPDNPNQTKCIDFMTDRLKYVLETDGAMNDLVLCVLESATPTIDNILTFLTQLEANKSTPEFKVIVETAIRIKRLGTAATTDFNPTLLTSEEHEIISPLLPFLEIEIVDLDQLIPVAEIMPRYFDKILVMDLDMTIRNNRLGLLRKLNIKFAKIGNFERILLI